MDKAREEEQAREEARKREKERKAREEARKRKAEAEREAAEKEAAEREAAAQAEKAEQARLDKEQADALAAQSSAPPSQPRFGLINARPIREIVGKVYTVYKTGGINIENAIFTISVGYEVKEDGSLYQVHIVKSSGSDDIDNAALNIANAL